MDGVSPRETIHATTIGIEGRGALILGASGSGKSALALRIIALGALLVADDRTILSVENGTLLASAPPTIEGLIEARGVGLLNLPHAGPTAITLVINLDKTEPERLPHRHEHCLLGITLPCLWRPESGDFAAAILLCLQHGISAEI